MNESEAGDKPPADHPVPPPEPAAEAPAPPAPSPRPKKDDGEWLPPRQPRRDGRKARGAHSRVLVIVGIILGVVVLVPLAGFVFLLAVCAG